MQAIISALAVLASSSGVVTERAAFMQLVKREVTRLQVRVGVLGFRILGVVGVDGGRMAWVWVLHDRGVCSVWLGWLLVWLVGRRFEQPAGRQG